MKLLQENQKTLSPAPDGLGALGRYYFPAWDDTRDLITFAGQAPVLEEEWKAYPALGHGDHPVVVNVRRADCGLGCRCAGEYQVVGFGHNGKAKP